MVKWQIFHFRIKIRKACYFVQCKTNKYKPKVINLLIFKGKEILNSPQIKNGGLNIVLNLNNDKTVNKNNQTTPNLNNYEN